MSIGVMREVREMAFAQYCELLGPTAQPLRFRDGHLFAQYQILVGARMAPSMLLKTPQYIGARNRTLSTLRETIRARHEHEPDGDARTLIATLATAFKLMLKA